MANSLTVKDQYIAEESQKTVTLSDLKMLHNPILERLAKSIENRDNLIGATNYSRMHNRHNRS